jgi:hypothetical protein
MKYFMHGFALSIARAIFKFWHLNRALPMKFVSCPLRTKRLLLLLADADFLPGA